MGQRDILIFFCRKLNNLNIPYLLTGSFATSFYGVPRATHDIDFIIEVSEKAQNPLIKLITDLSSDYIADLKEIKSSLKKQSMFNLFHDASGIKIDFWVIKSSEFSNKFQRKKIMKLNNLAVNLVSAEDLILTKLLWCREIFSERHFRDCAGIWQIQKNKLDSDYLLKESKKAGVSKLLNDVKNAPPA